MRLRVRRPRYAEVAASLALFISMGGTTYAVANTLPANSVDTQAIQDQAVTGPKIALDAVTGDRVTDGGLTGADVHDGTIGNADLAPNSVAAGKILDGSIGKADVGTDSVGTDEIVDESISSADLGTDSVGATEIADSSIDTGEIVDNSLFAADLAPNSVGSSELAADSVGTSEVANESLTLSDIAGAATSGSISLSGIPNGRCSQVTFNVGAAQVGDSVIVSTGAAIQNGIVLYPNRVSSAGHVEVNACNFSGTTMTAISGFPVRIVTFR